MPEPTIETKVKICLIKLYEIKSFYDCRLEFIEEYRGSDSYIFYVGDDEYCNIDVWLPEEVGVRLIGCTHDLYETTFNNKIYNIAIFKLTI